MVDDTQPTELVAATNDDQKPKSPFAAANKVVRHVQLTAVKFHSVSARALDPSNVIPEEMSLTASTRFLKPSVKTLDGGFSTTTTLVFHLRGELEGDRQPTIYAVVQATLEARYSFKDDGISFDDDELSDYALCYCPFHVWGYWREFVQASLARLDLPQLTIPLFLINQAPTMVHDRLE